MRIVKNNRDDYVSRSKLLDRKRETCAAPRDGCRDRDAHDFYDAKLDQNFYFMFKRSEDRRG